MQGYHDRLVMRELALLPTFVLLPSDSILLGDRRRRKRAPDAEGIEELTS